MTGTLFSAIFITQTVPVFATDSYGAPLSRPHQHPTHTPLITTSPPTQIPSKAG